jgi:hypothetical protein
MLKKKMFRNRSIALRPDLSLRHIAFLGAAAPAVKGLADFSFNQKDEFSAIDFQIETEDKSTLKTILEHITKLFKEQNQPEVKKMPTIEELTVKNTELTGKIDELTKGFDAFKEETKTATEKAEKEFSEKLEAEKKRADEAEAKIAEAGKAAKESEFSAFLDGEIEAGKILPADKATHLNMMNILDGQEPMNFGEGEGAKKVTPLELYKKQISEGPQKISFGESFINGTSGSATAGEQLTAKTREIEKSNPEMSYSEAFKQAQEENPELTKLYNDGK